METTTRKINSMRKNDRHMDVADITKIELQDFGS